MKTGLIDNKGQITMMPYYEIGIYLKGVCEEYRNMSIENNQVFEKFSKNYSLYEPYFDFALLNLNYKVLGPLLKEDCILYVHNNDYKIDKIEDYLCEIKTNETSNNLKTNSDNYEIEYINPENVKTSEVDANGRCYIVDRDKNSLHYLVCEQILNQMILYNEKICIDYYECMNKDKYEGYFPHINFYLRDRLGFTQIDYEDNEGYVLYNKTIANSYISSLLNRIKELNPGVQLLTSKINEEMIEETSNIIESMEDMYENRRIRF